MPFSRVLLIASGDMTWQVYVTEFQVSMDYIQQHCLSMSSVPDLIQSLLLSTTYVQWKF